MSCALCGCSRVVSSRLHLLLCQSASPLTQVLTTLEIQKDSGQISKHIEASSTSLVGIIASDQYKAIAY